MNNSGGYRFETEVVSSIKFYGYHVYKIGTPRHGKSVYDVAITANGKSIGVECKVISRKTSFPFNRLEPHQIDALLELSKAGGKGYVFINVRVRPFQLIAIEINEFVNLRDKYELLGRKSIPYVDLINLLQIVRTKTPPRWDVRKLFDE